jgi:membrane associated rhomboid family serine protease
MSPQNGGRGEPGALKWPDGFTLAIILVCAAIELTFQLADRGVIATPRLRFLAYTYGGFWPGLLSDWRPNFPGQSVAMFLTYSVFHGGFWHFLFNMITLLSLGGAVLERGGMTRYITIYVAAILGGAVVYGLLAPNYNPMVGASGALFGLVGALVAWDTAERRALRLTLRPVLRIILILAVMNLVLWWAMNGQLAWQTHLGGFLAGAAAAALLGERYDDEMPPGPSTSND